MKVLQIGKFYPPDAGGVETATRQVAEGLARMGASGEVLCFAGSCKEDEDTAVCRVHRQPVLATVASQPLSIAYVRKVMAMAPSFDALHVHLPNPLAALALFLARPKARIVLHWHSDVIGKGRLAVAMRPLETWLCRRADLVIGPTDVHVIESDRAREFRGKSAVVPFCVDASMARPEAADPDRVAALRQRFHGRRIVFALGRLVPYKGFDVLIAAAARLPLGTVTVIGGCGPLSGELAAKVQAAGLADRVHLPGRIPDADLPDWLTACDVFCLPSISRAEMFGIVQLEAMAFGKPVVSTAIPRSGVPWVNREGETGLLVPPGDARALAETLSRLLVDPDLQARLGQGGRDAVAGRFSPSAVDQALRQAYARI